MRLDLLATIFALATPIAANAASLHALTADGKLRNCLFARNEVDVKAILRSSHPDETELARIIRTNVAGKWAGHDFNTAEFIKPDRTMHSIGG